jgi:hypothetical protein
VLLDCVFEFKPGVVCAQRDFHGRYCTRGKRGFRRWRGLRATTPVAPRSGGVG